MHPYIEINAHHIGKSHSANGLSCEDYSITYSDDFVSIVAVSDGHGDKNCFRSALGARFACEVAVSECRRFRQSTGHIEQIDECDFESLVESLESDIADRWREKALTDAEHHPFSEDELSGASEQAWESYKNGSHLEKAYGCTLIIAMITESYWLAIQIGDGKCVAAYHDGAFVEPIPVDENCLGNRSTSLCNSNAKDSFRHYCGSVRPLAVFVSSDGIEESFDRAGLYNCLYTIAYWLVYDGTEIAKAKLDDLLPQISEGGSGDDVSLAVAVTLEDPVIKPRQSLDQVYERVESCSEMLGQFDSRLSDATNRLMGVVDRYSTIEMKIAELKEALAEKESALNAVVEEKGALESSVDQLTEKAKKAAEQFERAKAYQSTAEDFWLPRFEKLGITPPASDSLEEIAKEPDADDSAGSAEEVIIAVEVDVGQGAGNLEYEGLDRAGTDERVEDSLHLADEVRPAESRDSQEQTIADENPLAVARPLVLAKPTIDASAIKLPKNEFDDFETANSRVNEAYSIDHPDMLGVSETGREDAEVPNSTDRRSHVKSERRTRLFSLGRGRQDGGA